MITLLAFAARQSNNIIEVRKIAPVPRYVRRLITHARSLTRIPFHDSNVPVWLEVVDLSSLHSSLVLVVHRICCLKQEKASVALLKCIREIFSAHMIKEADLTIRLPEQNIDINATIVVIQAHAVWLTPSVAI